MVSGEWAHLPLTLKKFLNINVMIKTLIIAVLSLLMLTSARAQSTNITFVVKDQNTGFAVPGAVVQATAPNGQRSTLTTAANGKLTFTAVNGKYDFSIAANGYKALATYFSSGAETNLEARINLERVCEGRCGK
jgi:hypothetical protein